METNLSSPIPFKCRAHCYLNSAVLLLQLSSPHHAAAGGFGFIAPCSSASLLSLVMCPHVLYVQETSMTQRRPFSFPQRDIINFNAFFSLRFKYGV